ncbi:hypothetical protein VTN00DRAFT_5311 [Thermoascus crustaceus]|uniref:uncharacterized protein n=1 Tax=Thermoascus crustaceus TaxID=5088 RepID=UPI00374332F7
MPIAALPQSAVQAIGSTSALSDACSVVKELMDNALDASASSIFVEISQNTTDIIQVKDNGHGIPPEDHSLVCKRSFTSKIQTLEDLRKVGGHYLGFRGQALASASEMAGSLTVFTRVESQVVGSSLKYDREGELISSERTSHPVGTTMMHAYAIAQPSKRLSFKVLKSKNESNNWTYGPKPNATLVDAALRVAGPEIVSLCTSKVWPSEEPEQDDEAELSPIVAKIKGYKLVALLPKADADFSKVSNTGQFLSVDGRPMSASRGTCNEIAKLFKSYIRSAAKSSGNSASLSDPFLCLHIRCPEGSYDANVEPSKDDVLFEEPQILLSLAESLFKYIYGDMDGSSKDTGKTGVDEIPKSQVLTTRNPTVISFSQGQNSEYISSQATTARSQVSNSSPSLGSTQRTGIYDLQLQKADSASQRTTQRDLEAVNPWSIAKMNVSVRSSHDTSRNLDCSAPFLTPARGRESDRAREESTQMDRRFSGSPTLPSPSNSNSDSTSTSPSDARRSPLFVRHPQASPTASELNSSTRSARDRARDRERYGNGALDTWFQKTTQLSLSRQSVEDLAVQDYEETLSEQRGAERFGLQKLQSDFTTAASLLQSSSDRFKPFKSPLDPTRTSRQPQQNTLPSQDTEDYPSSPESEQPERRHEFPVMERWSSLLHQSSTQETSSELDEALDFERRKKSAMQARRLQMKNRLESLTQESSHSPSSFPHHKRYLAARAALNSSNNNVNINIDADTETPTQEEAEDSSSCRPRLNPTDPRAYFIRHRELDQQTEKTGGGLIKVRRVHNSKLPLERIPEGSNLHDVGLPCPITLESLLKSFKQGWKTDSYIRSGTGFDSFSSADSADSADWENAANTWEARLLASIREKYRAADGDSEPELDLDLDLFSTIKAHVDKLSQD